MSSPAPTSASATSEAPISTDGVNNHPSAASEANPEQNLRKRTNFSGQTICTLISGSFFVIFSIASLITAIGLAQGW
ncbi:hypothetical protein L596_009176 [Steinernema carpocapsae]|uniref:Uncharacterized protein n=1 Tax=Steinernema carpocapsae TaxID=34508 RepID=A0A4U5PEW1_STECR|nr:hypothetical protein L596_009176 [Steinernema carpocapsae]